MVIGVLQETGVHLHLPTQHGLEILRHLVPRGDLGVTWGQLALRRYDTELLLAGEGPLPQRVPAVVELAAVSVRPLLGDVMRGVGGAGREVDEERAVRSQGLLPADPADRLVGHVLHEVVARGLVHLDRVGALEQRGIPLVGFTADESVEVLESAAAGRPGVERSDRARLPHRHLMALAELGGVVAVELERARDRRHGVGQDRVVSRCAGCDLGDAAHAHRMVVAAREQRLPRRRAQRRGVETVVAQAVVGQPLRGRRATGTAERAGRAEPDIVEQYDEDVGGAVRRPHRLDRRITGIRVLGVEGDQSLAGLSWDRKMRPLHVEVLALCRGQNK